MPSHRLKQAFVEFQANLQGATSIEYAMIAAGISITIIAGIGLISGKLQAMYNLMASMM